MTLERPTTRVPKVSSASVWTTLRSHSAVASATGQATTTRPDSATPPPKASTATAPWFWQPLSSTKSCEDWNSAPRRSSRSGHCGSTAGRAWPVLVDEAAERVLGVVSAGASAVMLSGVAVVASLMALTTASATSSAATGISLTACAAGTLSGRSMGTGIHSSSRKARVLLSAG